MIISLTGQLHARYADTIIITVNGVGYQVFMATTTQDTLPTLNETITVSIYHHIRDNGQTLYGFLNLSERDFFIQLTAVSGIGPKVGLKLLSGLSSHAIKSAIMNDDVTTLTQISGVGKKMAERIIVELNDKIMTLNTTPHTETPSGTANDTYEIQLALQTLGYKSHEIRTTLQTMTFEPDSTVEEKIKSVLKQL